MTGSRPSLRRGLASAGALVALVALVQAASPAFWRVSTQDEFLRGEVENVSVDADGQLLLGPAAEVVYETTAPFLWSVARASETLWIGSGGDGKVFRVQPDGIATTVYDADEQNVHTVAPLDGETAYVGTSPGGAVLRVTTDSAQTVFDPEERYIWALAVDADQNLFVATGDQGRIYRVSPDGTSMLFYDTKTTHVLSLAIDPAGNLLAGTGAPGQVFRIDRDQRAFVVLDSPFGEIRALRSTADGTVYAVAASPQTRPQLASPTVPSSSPGVPSVSTSTSITAVVVADTTPTSPPPSQPTTASPVAAPGGGAVYRIAADGVWDVVWQSSEDSPYDVSVGDDGDLIIGTGGTGKIFRVTEDPLKVVLLTRAPAQQVTSFAAGRNGDRYYVTANPGKVYRLAARRATTGGYLSEVRDAATIATWGTVRWRATTPGDSSVHLFTRSGNTATANETWSPWSDAYTDSTGSQITSPKARYVQWRAVLSGTRDTPALLSVTTAYLPRNLRPEITSLTVHDPGIVFQRPFSSGDPPIAGLDDGVEARSVSEPAAATGETQQTTLGRRVYRKGLQTFVWTARDQNQDQLQFDVLYRSEAASTWYTLRTELNDAVFAWDTTSAPDGTYVIRVVASDSQSNAPGTALTGAAESTPVDIDNSAPTISLEPLPQGAAQTVFTFVVTDSHSPVQHVEYSLDNERWQVVYPVDGIPDSQVERFEIVLEPSATERLVVRATDAMNNTATTAGR